MIVEAIAVAIVIMALFSPICFLFLLFGRPSQPEQDLLIEDIELLRQEARLNTHAFRDAQKEIFERLSMVERVAGCAPSVEAVGDLRRVVDGLAERMDEFSTALNALGEAFIKLEERASQDLDRLDELERKWIALGQRECLP